jgi:hypothetical protein
MFVVVAAAHGNRVGQGPIYRPHVTKSAHVTFTLQGDHWGQALGLTGATPELGRYGQKAGRGCRMTANVSATVTAYRPIVHGTHVSIPGHFGSIKVADHGRDHGVRWWSGSHVGVRAAVLGYQPAGDLARRGHRWLTYQVILRGVSKNPSCTKTQGLRTARVIARSMHVNDGPVKVTGPYY